jgi:signal transduction histidine kinase
VADTGVGIAAGDMQKLFTEGGRGEHSKEANPESTGYGLFIAKQIVEAHGGRIWASSNGPGTGSTFFIEFLLG